MEIYNNVNDASYDVRYAPIDSSLIFNFLEPKPHRFKNNPKFYQEIEKSVLENGFFNPVIVVVQDKNQRKKYFMNNLPAKIRSLDSPVVVCIRGGSRLWVAQRNKLSIPCIICDYTNAYNEAEKLHSVDQINAKFKYPPENITLTEYGIVLKD